MEILSLLAGIFLWALFAIGVSVGRSQRLAIKKQNLGCQPFDSLPEPMLDSLTVSEQR
jgi:hypothetical protein